MAAVERFLGAAGFDRMPWLAVAFGAGIAAWFGMPVPAYWAALLVGCCALAAACAALLQADGRYPYLRLAGLTVPLVIAAGCASVWTRSHLVGAEPIARPTVATLTGRVLTVEPQPARARSRIVLAMREPGTARAIRVRLNLPDETADGRGLIKDSVIRVRARLVPPAPPMLPGAYDFSRAAWFAGLSATGTALEPPRVIAPAASGMGLRGWQRGLSEHVRTRLAPSEAGIAAALAPGDTGGVAAVDADAMRDSGLAHLLSVSGLHVSAVIGAVFFVTLKLLAMWPWLALRVRLPIVAAGTGALAGIAYTLLTGAQVPTVRSCIGALLVLAALALGREALSLRMLAIAAFLVMLLWPEAVVGPSFQMSFAAVLAIVALSGAEPIRRFLAPRDLGFLARGMRNLALMLLTGVVIEIALMPIGLYHFHRAGFYGAVANMIAIPLTTLVIMPAVLLALMLDIVGLGAPVWWLAGQAIATLTALAHWVASRPGAVTVMPPIGGTAFALFVVGGLWLGLWSGRIRWWGLAPAIVGAVLVVLVRPPDLLVSGDGRHVGLVAEDGSTLFVLRESRSEFARENLLEIAGMNGTPISLTTYPGARCNADTCVLTLRRGGRDWLLLLTRSRGALPERALAAACERVDIVLSDRWLPRSCQPRWLKADRSLLARSGGLALDLRHAKVTSVASGQGQHGWWRVYEDRPRPRLPQARSESIDTASPASDAPGGP
jgi:competence protein ComEC